MGILDIIAQGGRQGKSLGDISLEKQSLDLRRKKLSADINLTKSKRLDALEAKSIISATQSDVSSMGGSREEQTDNFMEIASDRARATGNLPLLNDLQAASKSMKSAELGSSTLDVRKQEETGRQERAKTAADISREGMKSREKLADLRIKAESAKTVSIRSNIMTKLKASVNGQLNDFVSAKNFHESLGLFLRSNEGVSGGWDIWNNMSEKDRGAISSIVESKIIQTINRNTLTDKPEDILDLDNTISTAFEESISEWQDRGDLVIPKSVGEFSVVGRR